MTPSLFAHEPALTRAYRVGACAPCQSPTHPQSLSCGHPAASHGQVNGLPCLQLRTNWPSLRSSMAQPRGGCLPTPGTPFCPGFPDFQVFNHPRDSTRGVSHTLPPRTGMPAPFPNVCASFSLLWAPPDSKIRLYHRQAIQRTGQQHGLCTPARHGAITPALALTSPGTSVRPPHLLEPQLPSLKNEDSRGTRMAPSVKTSDSCGFGLRLISGSRDHAPPQALHSARSLLGFLSFSRHPAHLLLSLSKTNK